MIVNFDAFDRRVQPELWLCDPGCTYDAATDTVSNLRGVIVGAHDVELNIQFNTLSELGFAIPCTDENAELYKLVQNRRYVFAEGLGFFVITSCQQQTTGDERRKTVRAVSCEKELENVKLPYVPNRTCTLKELLVDGWTDEHDTMASFSGMEGYLPGWHFRRRTDQVVDIPTGIEINKRTFEDLNDEQNLLAFLLEEVQDAFECVFVFDCLRREISIYSRDLFVVPSGIHLTPADFLQRIEVSENADDVYTAITVRGNDNTIITAVNPVGSNTIYNFSHYSDWMSEGLQEAVGDWNDAVQALTEPYQAANKTKYDALAAMADAEAELERLSTLKEIYAACLSNAENADDITGYNSSLESLNEAELPTGKQACIDAVSTRLDDIDVKIESQNITLSIEQGKVDEQQEVVNQIVNGGYTAGVGQTPYKGLKFAPSSDTEDTYFTPEQFSELTHYIAEATYTDDYTIITSDMTDAEKFEQMQTLYTRAKMQLQRICRPTQEFSVDVENFLFTPDLSERFHELSVGTTVAVELEDGDVADLFLTGITVNYQDESLRLTFSSRLCRTDVKALYEDVFAKVHKTANTLSYVKDAVYPLRTGVLDKLTQFIKDSRSLAKSAALASTSQEIIIDDTGYTGRQLLPGSTTEYEDEWLKITNNRIVFLKDNEARAVVGKFPVPGSATDEQAYGINAEYLVGETILGERLSLGIMIDNERIGLDTAIRESLEHAQWLQFDANTGLTIGATTPDGEYVPILTNITNARYSFRRNGSEIMFLDASEGGVYAPQVHINDRLAIGKVGTGSSAGYVDFIASSSGLGLKWRAASSNDTQFLRSIGEVTITANEAWDCAAENIASAVVLTAHVFDVGGTEITNAQNIFSFNWYTNHHGWTQRELLSSDYWPFGEDESKPGQWHDNSIAIPVQLEAISRYVVVEVAGDRSGTYIPGAFSADFSLEPYACWIAHGGQTEWTSGGDV